MRFRRVVRGLLLALVAATLPAAATTGVAPLGVDELTALADLAIEGRVVSIRAREVGRQIFTDIEVEVVDAVKGRPGKVVRLRLYGGVANGRRTTVVGAPCLTAGEEVFLFLKSVGAQAFGVVNLSEGKFAIARGPAGVMVERDLRGITYLDARRPLLPRTLSELKAAVRAAAGTVGAAGREAR
jgi:hypothetical protein